MAATIGNAGQLNIGVNKILNLISVDWAETAEVPESTALGDAWKTFLEGGTKGFTANASGYRDEADTTGQAVLLIGAKVTLLFYPDGIGTGLPSLTGDVIISGDSASMANDTTNPISFTMQGTGAFTAAVQA